MSGLITARVKGRFTCLGSKRAYSISQLYILKYNKIVRGQYLNLLLVVKGYFEGLNISVPVIILYK